VPPLPPGGGKVQVTSGSITVRLIRSQPRTTFDGLACDGKGAGFSFTGCRAIGSLRTDVQGNAVGRLSRPKALPRQVWIVLQERGRRPLYAALAAAAARP
jgi:hypothetical protein